MINHLFFACSAIFLIITFNCNQLCYTDTSTNATNSSTEKDPYYSYRLPGWDEPINVIEPTSNHTATMIFIHDLGDSGFGMDEVLRNIAKPYMKIICPTANVMNVSSNPSVVCHAWYNFDPKFQGPPDREQIRKSNIYIHHIMRREMNIHKIPCSNMFIVGFGHGGPLAFHVVRTFRDKMPGIVLINHWPRFRGMSRSKTAANKNTQYLLVDVETEPERVATLPENCKFNTYTGAIYGMNESDVHRIHEFMERATDSYKIGVS